MKKRITILCSFLSLFISGCGTATGNTYTDVTNAVRNTPSSSVDTTGLSWSQSIVAHCSNFYLSMRSIAPLIMIVSFLFGTTIYLLIRKAKPIRKIALFVFMIGIPAVTFITVYLFAILLGTFQ